MLDFILRRNRRSSFESALIESLELRKANFEPGRRMPRIGTNWCRRARVPLHNATP